MATSRPAARRRQTRVDPSEAEKDATNVRVMRIDRVRCRLDFDVATPTPEHAAARATPEGYLIVDAYLARDGLLRYSDGIRSWLEYRPADELERAADSFAHVPITDDHPPKMLSAENTREYARGFTLAGVRTELIDGVTYLRGSLKITDAALVAKILDGRHEISIGMWSRVEVRDGTYQGQLFKAVQTECTGNHVASVDKGRAGAAVRVFMDGAQIPVQYMSTLMHEVAIPADLLAVLAGRLDEIGAPTTEAKLIGPDGTEIVVPTWVAALVEELKELKKPRRPWSPLTPNRLPSRSLRKALRLNRSPMQTPPVSFRPPRTSPRPEKQKTMRKKR